MGKQAKKKAKSETQAAKQNHHNRATRGINTTRKQIVWDTKQEVYKDKDGKEKVRTVDIAYPPNLQWDWSRIYDVVNNDEGVAVLMRRKPEKQKPLPAPLDTLLEDTWELELAEYASENDAKVERTPLGDGRIRHDVWRNEIDPRTLKEKRRKVIFSITSSRKVRIPKRKGKFRKKN
jgi:hypothetical protein